MELYRRMGRTEVVKLLVQHAWLQVVLGMLLSSMRPKRRLGCAFPDSPPNLDSSRPPAEASSLLAQGTEVATRRQLYN